MLTDAIRRCMDCGEPTLPGKPRCRPHHLAKRNGYKRAARARPGFTRAESLRQLYGITPAEYDAMREAQGGRCAICRVHEDDIDLSRVGGRPRADGTRVVAFGLNVDHDHATGALRKLLCPDCNRGIGLLGEDPARLRAAADYIEAHRATDGSEAA